MIMELTFPSQMTFHPYGHLICTPTSILAASSYLKIPYDADDEIVGVECYPIRSNKKRKYQNIEFNQIQACFTPLHVQQMMLASHTLYRDFFSGKGQQLMIQDIYPWIPKDSYEIMEAGGLILSQHPTTDVPIESPGDEIIISPLFELLGNISAVSLKSNSKACIIVTAKSHTTCYMCSENGQLFYFDPLPASLSVIPQNRLRETLMALYGVRESVMEAPKSQQVEYSAIVMRNVEKRRLL
jgi:hypothetical protein